MSFPAKIDLNRWCNTSKCLEVAPNKRELLEENIKTKACDCSHFVKRNALYF